MPGKGLYSFLLVWGMAPIHAQTSDITEHLGTFGLHEQTLEAYSRCARVDPASGIQTYPFTNRRFVHVKDAELSVTSEPFSLDAFPDRPAATVKRRSLTYAGLDRVSLAA